MSLATKFQDSAHTIREKVVALGLAGALAFTLSGPFNEAEGSEVIQVPTHGYTQTVPVAHSKPSEAKIADDQTEEKMIALRRYVAEHRGMSLGILLSSSPQGEIGTPVAEAAERMGRFFRKNGIENIRIETEPGTGFLLADTVSFYTPNGGFHKYPLPAVRSKELVDEILSIVRRDGAY